MHALAVFSELRHGSLRECRKKASSQNYSNNEETLFWIWHIYYTSKSDGYSLPSPNAS